MSGMESALGIGFIVFLSLLTPSPADYHDYKVSSNRVCSNLREKSLDINNSSVVVRDGGHFQGLGSLRIKPFDCRWGVVKQEGMSGIVAVVQRAILRTNSSGSCVDYLMFEEPKVRQRKKQDEFSVDQTGFDTILDYDESEVTSEPVTSDVTSTQAGPTDKNASPKSRRSLRRIIFGTGIKRPHKLKPKIKYSGWNHGPAICGDLMFGMYFNGTQGNNDTATPTNTTANVTASTSQMQSSHPWSSLIVPGAVIHTKRDFKTYLHISNASRYLLGDRQIELIVAYTDFKECNGTTVSPSDPNSALFHCGHGLCISKSHVNDGVVNCPFGDCIDEEDCKTALFSNKTEEFLGFNRKEREEEEGALAVTSSSIIGILVILGCCGGVYCLVKRCKTKPGTVISNAGGYSGVPTSAPAYPTQQSAYPVQQGQGQPMYLQGQPMYPQGQGMPPQGPPVYPQGQAIPVQGQPVYPQGQAMPVQGPPVYPQGQTMPVQGPPVYPQVQAMPVQGQPVYPQTQQVSPQDDTIIDPKSSAATAAPPPAGFHVPEERKE